MNAWVDIEVTGPTPNTWIEYCESDLDTLRCYLTKTTAAGLLRVGSEDPRDNKFVIVVPAPFESTPINTARFWRLPSCIHCDETLVGVGWLAWMDARGRLVCEPEQRHIPASIVTFEEVVGA